MDIMFECPECGKIECIDNYNKELLDLEKCKECAEIEYEFNIENCKS